jgi:hypothetical protein
MKCDGEMISGATIHILTFINNASLIQQCIGESQAQFIVNM